MKLDPPTASRGIESTFVKKVVLNMRYTIEH